VSLDPSGVAVITRSNLPGGDHTIRAIYASDTQFASSSLQMAQVVHPAPNQTFQFVNENVNAAENIGSVTIGVSRSGDVSVPASVDYSTSDIAQADPCNVSGMASSRCDYVTRLGTLQFAAGETMKTISIP